MSETSTLSSAAVGIARAKKERFILQMSEDQFRDEVVRPLLIRMGLQDGRDLCGPQEEGKDAVFVTKDPLGIENVYVLQTKKGPLNMASRATSNVITAITQVRMASETKVYFPLSKQSRLPTKVVLCASGKINETAKRHIVNEVPAANLVFMDSEDLIPKIDALFPELWFGIDANLLPYLRIIKQDIEQKSEGLLVSEMLPGGANVGAATDGMFVSLNLFRIVPKIKTHRGLYSRETKIEEMPAIGILSSQKPLFLVLGEAGAGKSTLLRRLAYELSKKGLEGDEGITVPIMVKAIDILRSLPQSLLEICALETRRITQTSSPSFTASSLEKGKVIIFVDALDELPSDEDRALIAKSIKVFNDEYPRCKFVVTSRELRYFYNYDDFGKFQTYRISPISYKQAEKIVDQLQKGKKGVPPEGSKEIIRQLQEVHGMDLNPLLVTVFVATTEYTRQDIPANITELFKKFTEMMLGRWDASKGLTQQFQAPLKDFVLQRAAFEMHKRKVTQVTDTELKAMIETELAARGHKQDSAKIVEELVHRSGLLSSSGSVIQFRHHLLQEFFAGRGIPSIEYLQTIIADDWWRRAIVFYFGDNAAKSSLLEEVIASQRSKSDQDNNGAALTIGLALQACYLAKTASKVRVLRWVIEALSKDGVRSRKVEDDSLPPPLLSFILYYLIGRDSVACKFIAENLVEITKPWLEEVPPEEEKNLRDFWLIVGMIESGELDKASTLIRKFRPIDSKLFLGLHLGCLLIQQHRVASNHQRQVAGRICGSLAGRIGSLRSQLINEIEGELLEVRRGQIKLIDNESKEIRVKPHDLTAR